MKTKRSFRSSLALLLSLVMMFSVMTPMMAFTASAITVDTSNIGSNTKLTSKTDYAVAPGVTESHIITHNKDGSNQVQSYALEIDLSNPNVGIIASYKNYMNNLAPTATWGMQTVRDQAVAAENYYKNVKNEANFEVIGGINCDFFNMQTGAPLGSLVMDGVVYNETKTGANSSYFAILDDGSAVIGSGEIPENAVEVVGGSTMLVQNGVINPDIKGNMDKFPRTSIGLTADGKVIFVTADGRQAPSSCGQTFEENAQQMLSLGCVTALQVDGGGSATLVSQREGETSLTVRNSPSDGVERIVSSSLLVYSNATPDGEFDHANLAPVNELYTPGSTVEFTATGVDGSGAVAELPAEGVFALANAEAGTIDPATGVFTAAEGYTGDVTVNYIVGEAVKGSTTVTIVIPDALSVASPEQAVGPGVETNFGIVAKYQDRDVNMKSDDIAWSIVDQATGADLNGIAGTFSGLTFTGAEDDAYNAKVTASLVCNSELMPLEIIVFIGSKQIILYDFEYTTDAEEAATNENLEYIPSYSMPIFDRSSSLTSAQQAAIFYEEGYPLYNWPNESIEDQKSMKSTIVSDDSGQPVRFGEKSLKIDYNYATYNGDKNSNNYLRVTCPDYHFEGSPTALGMWIYIPEGTADFVLYANCANKNYSYAYAPLTGDNGIDWIGWKYVEIPLNAAIPPNGSANIQEGNAPFGFYQGCGIFWISYQPGPGRGDKTASTVYIDDITLIYGANTSDTINPTVNYIGGLVDPIVDGETVYTSNTNTFKASYADVEDKYMTGIDDTATKMYIDGVDVTDKCYINEGDDEIYFYDAVLADGVHNIEVEVADVFGNKTTEMRYFTIDSNTEDTEVAFEAVNVPYLGDDYKLAITTNNAANIAAADIEVKVLSNFTSYWRNVTVEPAANYELVGEAVYNSINDTLSFKVERKADAVPENDDGTIATVLTRVPTDTPANLEVTHRIAKGELTYVNATEDKFTTGFSGKVISTCAALLTVSTDAMIVGAPTGNVIVSDALTGEPVVNAEIYRVTEKTEEVTEDELLGTTDENGVLATDAFVGAVQQFEIYAMHKTELTPADPDNGVEATYKTLRSFNYKTQSCEAKGDVTGLPTYVKLNAAEDPSTEQNISWMANPLYTADKAVVLYAEKAAYDSNGEETVFTELTGTSYLSEMKASGNINTNYVVRLNGVTVTGLKADTEYVYKVGDGTTWSEIKTFKTTRAGTATDFFIIGDIQSENKTDVTNIKAALTETGINFTFGIQTGDLVDNGANYKYWDAVADTFSTDILGSTDIVHVLGNHEYYGDLVGVNAAHYFTLPGEWTDEAPIAYSVEYGNVYVAVINYVGMSSYAEACEWLIEDAAESTATWKILTMHQPAYFTNPGGASSGLQELISSTADAADIDFVLSGHDHSYARTEPLTAGEIDAENGTVYIICGSTGEKAYDIVDNPNHHYACLNEDYESVYMTVSTTDTTFTINTYDCKRADGSSELIDTYTATKAVTCTDKGHDYVLDNGWLVCSVCGFTKEVEDYTGLAKDPGTGRLMKLVNGVPETGWVEIDGDIYYLDENGVAVSGETKVGDYTYPLDENGKLTKFAFLLEDGTLATNRWIGNQYLGADGLLVTGEYSVTEEVRLDIRDNAPTKVLTLTYTFDEDGNLVKGAFNKNGNYTFYYLGGQPQRGWHNIDGYWYYCDRQTGGGIATLEHDGKTSVDTVKDGMYPVESSDGTSLLFTFDNDGKLVKGAWSVTDNGTVFYWANNERLKGLQEIDGVLYYFDSDYYMLVNDSAEVDGVVYAFDENGQFIHYEDHVDTDENGACDHCESRGRFTDFINKITTFVEKIKNFFTKLFK